jgi:RimJ/RimL family protein N-acetyltransferase
MFKYLQLDSCIKGLLEFTPLQYMLHTASENPELVQIFTDRENEPQCCAMIFGHYVFAGGKMSRHFVRELVQQYFTYEIREAMEIVIVFYDSPGVADCLRQSFEKTYDYERSLYWQKPAIGQDEAGSNESVPINQELLQSDIKNLAMITDEVTGTTTYRDMDDFCRRGIGFAFVSGGEICGFCTSEYPSQSSVAIGIEVSEAFRHQGIATEMTKRFLQQAAARSLNVYWECWKRNEASVQTALKCGFEKVADYPVLFISLKQP